MTYSRTTVLLLPILLAVAWGSEDVCDGDARTVSCQSPLAMHSVIVALKQEIYEMKASQDNNCTVCWSDPCQNGGSCAPLSTTQYRCDCLDDYTGTNCQTHLKCMPNSCGPNTNCFVAGHKINCVCQPGYSGNPNTGCSVKTKQTCLSGDPHYVTFDSQLFDYMGTCPYTLVKFCGGQPIDIYDYFEVKVRNQLRSPGAHVSYVHDVEVTTHGQKVYIDEAAHVYFNGVKQTFPYYYPSRSNPTISVTYSNYIVTIANDQQFTVTLGVYSTRLCVDVPDVAPLRGPKALCGVGGNNDGDCLDDFIDSTGKQYPVTTCKNSYQDFTEKFGDSWITQDFLAFTPGVSTCLTGVEVHNGSLSCDLEATKKLCLPIQDAANGIGAFAVCQPLGAAAIEMAYEDCVFDACQTTPICNLFSAFAVQCLQQIPNPNLDWRPATGCPPLHCQIHSIYKPCATGCPQTCDSPNYNQQCTQGCLEGCECDPGYLLDNGDPADLKCVLLPECGCKDDQGNYHKANEPWLSDDCTTVSSCINGTLHKQTKPCAADATCTLNTTRQHQCVCNKGYDGDGYTCSDIDECLDPMVCNSGFLQGECTNVPGSYGCTCHPYYDDGGNCDKFLPLRHCADLLIYHGQTTDGVYEIKPAYSVVGNPPFTPTSVYCDMTTEDGGWTLMSGSAKDSMANKTYDQYVQGFGDPAQQDVWLGLEFIRQMVKQMNTSLRLNIVRCPTRNGRTHPKTYCTYPNIKILDAASGYAVVLSDWCDGSEVDKLQDDDGWFMWTGTGPAFATFDNDNNGDCATKNLNTGWWYDTEYGDCGFADLNGVRYDCDNKPKTMSGYLEWDHNLIEQVTLYLRPSAYPDYDVEVPLKIHVKGTE